MPLPVIEDVIRTSLYGTVEGGIGWSNTIHFKKDATDTFATAIGNIHAELQILYSVGGYGGTQFGWGHFATDGSSVSQIVSTPLDGTTASTVLAVNLPGSSSQEPLPPQNAIAITLVTGLRGRSRRGRVFWPATSREVMSGGKLSAANAGYIDSTWEAFGDALGAYAKPILVGVASYKLGDFVPCLEPTPTQTRLVYAHQSKRRGRGA